MKQNELKIFKAGMVLMSTDKKFIIITEDHNSKKGRKFFKQNQNAWNDAVEEAAHAGYKIVLPKYDSVPYVRYMSGKPPIKNVVKINHKIYGVESLINMSWPGIINIVLTEINNNRKKYYAAYAKQFFFTKSANMTIVGGPKFKFRESLRKPKTFIRIDKNEFKWIRSGNSVIMTGNGELKQHSNIYYLKGTCYWTTNKYYNQSARLLAQLIPVVTQPLPPLNEKTMWQEIIFEPIPLINEPVIGSNGKINQLIIDKNYKQEVACYASHM